MARQKVDYPERNCEYELCGIRFKPTRGDQKFHRPVCRKAYYREGFVRVRRSALRKYLFGPDRIGVEEARKELKAALKAQKK